MTMTAIMLTVMLTMAVAIVPRIYCAFIQAEESYQYLEVRLLWELLEERKVWVLRHFRLGLGALILIWISQSFSGMEIPFQLTAALAIYTVSSLNFAILETLLAQRITSMLASIPAPIRERAQR
jgi:hypothetical protein